MLMVRVLLLKQVMLKEKYNGLNAMEEETQKTLAGIQAAIAGYKERMKNNINDNALTAKKLIWLL